MNASTDSRRNHGIDLLKTVAMLLVILTHLLTHGGLFNAATQPLQRFILRAIFSYTPQGVDLFVLASGFLLYEKRFRAGRLLELLSTVLFYAVSVTVVLGFIFPIHPDWPAILSDYWFFNRYFLLALFAPILNGGLARLNETISPEPIFWRLFLLCPALFFLPLQPQSGNSVIWFCVLYLLGAQTKVCMSSMQDTTSGNMASTQTRHFWNLPNAILLTIVIALPVLTACCCRALLLYGFSTYPLVESKSSPIVCLSALSLLVLFARIRTIPSPGFFKFLASGAFGVYLLHDHMLVRSILVNGCTVSFTALPLPAELAALLGTTLLVFLLGTIIDAFRRTCFRLARMDRLVAMIDEISARNIPAKRC